MIKDNLQLKVYVISLINKYFGATTANLYKEFYEKKETEEILMSIEELLVDYLGKEKAGPYLDEIIKLKK